MCYNKSIERRCDVIDKDDLQTAVNLIVIGEALIKIGKAMKKKLSGKKKRKKKRPRKRRQ